MEIKFDPQIRKFLFRSTDYHDECHLATGCPPVGPKLHERWNAGSGRNAHRHRISIHIRVMNFVINIDPKDKVIVYCGRKTRADNLSSELALPGINCTSLHDDREQADLEQTLEGIKSGDV